MATNAGDEAATGRVVTRYRTLLAAGKITEEPAQLALAKRLDALDQALSDAPPPSRGKPLGWLFGGRGGADSPVKGLYIHGPVGRGKTMLMDAFFASARLEAKRRAHFHAFMSDVHDRVHAHRARDRRGGKGPDDPIAPVAADIASGTRLLCLDEFAVEDITDAMILSRLFSALFDDGLVLVATSNTAPEDLYRHGLNRALFLPFVDVLREHVDVVELDGRTDHRLAKLGEAGVYFTPSGDDARAMLDGLWQSLADGDPGGPLELDVKGRRVRVPKAAGGIARFGFRDLCEAPLGTSDFTAIAEAFDMVMVDDIPVIAAERRDIARRFINLVDVFYDRGVKLIVSAAAEPEVLYKAPQGREAFAFRRTVSRLTEMRSGSYVSAVRPRRRAASGLPA
ncbi:MAG: AFG1 family ATPase [Bauldia sp.]|uniref:cell division protein ZapE n=1 Tax=Bauldia sp. TaxID=2575872 RepID=UPI001D6179D1|nr:cell division protein ZapE [Bauldia sp.]MCB1495596.1 AFG1 family ATPase [Bauldia sp.]